MIDVAHHRHHRRPAASKLSLVSFLGNFQHHFFFQRNNAHYATERFRECRSRRYIQRLVDAGEDTAVEQVFSKLPSRAHPAFSASSRMVMPSVIVTSSRAGVAPAVQ